MKPAHPMLALLACCVLASAQTAPRPRQPPQVPTEPFTGITLGGPIEPGLFEVRSTGVSTEPVRKAAQAFLDGLTEEQRTRTQFPGRRRRMAHVGQRHCTRGRGGPPPT